VRDARTRISNARTYAGDLVRQARKFIFKLGLGVASAAVERVLKPNSWVPTLVCGIVRVNNALTYSRSFRIFSQKNSVVLVSIRL
jgi:hypothetical protein